MTNKFTGLGVALVTPFDQKGDIDITSLRRLVEYLCQDKGANFLVVHGSTGESPCLNREERDIVTQCVVEVNNGRLPIMVGLGGNNTKEIVQRFIDMDTNGIDGVLSVVPYYNKPSQEGIYKHFASIAEVSPLPIVLYNVPGRVSVNMVPETVCRLANEYKNIIGVKEASGYPIQTENIKTIGVPDDFVILSGDDALSIPIIQNGAMGVISVVGNAYPELFSKCIHLAMDGKYNEADLIMLQLRNINNLLFANGNPSGIKALLYQMGLIDYNVLRLPLLPVSKQVYDGLTEARMVLEAQMK